MKRIDITKSFKSAVDVIVCFLILFLSIKKGGFYTTDMTFFINSIITLGASYILFFIIKYYDDRQKNKCEKFSIKNIITISNIKSTVILFALLAIAYVLPILFKTAANIQDSEFEFLRYVGIFFVYIIIKNSDNKKIYYYTLMSIGVLQIFIGIDGLASRILQPYFRILNSGYLSKDLTRLSGTIQYANTTAILIAISGILILDKINEYTNKVKKSCTKLNKRVLSIFFALFTASNLSIILTSSRMVLSIYTVTLIIYLLKNKTNKFNLLTIIIISYVISFLASNNILDLVLTNPSRVYFVFLTYMVLSIISIVYIIKHIILNESLVNKIGKIKFNKIKVIAISTIVLLTYILVGINIYKPLTIVNNTKENTVSRQVYGLKYDEINHINISVKENEVGSKYSIIVHEENNEFVQNVLTRFEYYDNKLNEFNFDFTPQDNAKRINIELICYSGSVSITKFKLNEKIKPLEYSILPSEMVFRFKDSFNGSTSIMDRMNYIKDSYKIWLKSPIVGTGGEGFKHLYRSVQTFKYTSTEAHNSILQIFVESGVVGGIAVCLLIFVVLKNNKYSTIKLVFIMFIIHSVTDLNFSFLTCLVVFTMLIGIMENKNEIKE